MRPLTICVCFWLQLRDLNVLDHFGDLSRQAKHLLAHLWCLVESFFLLCSKSAAVAPMGRECEREFSAGVR